MDQCINLVSRSWPRRSRLGGVKYRCVRFVIRVWRSVRLLFSVSSTRHERIGIRAWRARVACVPACYRTCVRACVRACVCVCACACACLCVHARQGGGGGADGAGGPQARRRALGREPPRRPQPPPAPTFRVCIRVPHRPTRPDIPSLYPGPSQPHPPRHSESISGSLTGPPAPTFRVYIRVPHRPARPTFRVYIRVPHRPARPPAPTCAREHVARTPCGKRGDRTQAKRHWSLDAQAVRVEQVRRVCSDCLSGPYTTVGGV